MPITSQTPYGNRFISPKVLASTTNLHLIARTVVQGFISGLHRSPYHGFSLEFAEYREYSPGDDIRRVDWKVYGRTDRFYVKKFEGDTNTQVFLLLDISRSMTYSTHSVSKRDYAMYLAASLAYFAVRQHDAVGLVSFDSAIREFIPARTRHGHLLTLLSRLEKLPLGNETNIAATLKALSGLIRKRSLIILISDLYQDPEQLGKALRYFHHRGNDVILFHVMDPQELNLPISNTTTLEDLETGVQLPFSPDHSRMRYLEMLNAHLASLRRECRNVKIDYELLDTSEPLDRALFRYLSTRTRRI